MLTSSTTSFTVLEISNFFEDKEYVQNAFKQLIENGVYPEKLWK